MLDFVDHTVRRRLWLAVATLGLVLLAGCGRPAHRPGELLQRSGDEIVVCGQLYHTGAPVVLWMDPGGYDAYRVERRFAPIEEASWAKSQSKDLDTPNRYDIRKAKLTPEQLEQVRGGGWPLALLPDSVDQFVIHYDVCGTSRQCFKVLHDLRGLSVHFMLDIDGTIYQTLDLKERAWHATTSNHRSVGIEIANMGAYGAGEKEPFAQWYATDPDGKTRLTIPASMGDGGVRTAGFVGRPIRNEIITGTINGRSLRQYDFTPQQYESLAKLTATLCTIFPKITPDYPRDADGQLINDRLPDDQLAAYQGLIGHFHIQKNKVDPGPAFQWDRLVANARTLMGGSPASRRLAKR